MPFINQAASTKGKLLIIDDESEVREVLRIHLESAKYTQTNQVCGKLFPVISKFSVRRVASSSL